MRDSFALLGATPVQQSLTRAEWVARFSRIQLKGLVAVAPDQETYSLDAGWSLIRIGSFWRRDEEFHVYGMEHAVEAMISQKRANPNVVMNIVTPVFVFKRAGSRAVHDTSDGVLATAGRNFMRFFDEVYKRRISHG